MPTDGPMYTPAQQAENAEKARKDVGPAAEINSKPDDRNLPAPVKQSTPTGPGLESQATADKRAADAKVAEKAGNAQPATEKSPAPKPA